MKTVKQLVADKSPVVWSIEPHRPVIDAITIMAEKEIGALLVTENRQLTDILTHPADVSDTRQVAL